MCRLAALRAMSVLGLAGVLAAQSAEDEFARLFRAAVEGGATATTAEGFQMARRDLDAAAALVDELPAARRGQARFFIGVRRAELHALAGETAAVREVAERVRSRALAEPAVGGKPVYGGYYRVLLQVLLWQSAGMSEYEFFAQLEQHDEAAFLLDVEIAAEVERRAPAWLVPLQLLCCELRFRRGEEFAAARSLQQLADSLPQRSNVPAAWREQCLLRVAWYHIGRRDYERAEVYLRRAGPDRTRYLRALIALRRGDFTTAEAEGRLLVAVDQRYSHLLGEALELQGRLGEALALFRVAEGVARAQHEPLDRALALNSIGDCYRYPGELQDLALAEERYRQALDVLDTVAGKRVEDERSEMLMNLGRVAELNGRRVEANRLFERALVATEAARHDIPRDVLGGSWLRGEHVVPSVDGMLRTCDRGATGCFSALAATEMVKARGLLDWMAAPPAVGEIGALRAAIRELALADPKDVDERRAALERARGRLPRARARATADSAEHLRALVASRPDTLFLSYWMGEASVWLIAARGAWIERFELGSRDSGVATLRQAYQAVALRQSDPWPALDAAADYFLPPAVRQWWSPGVRVVFCPDERLHLLPFEALRLAGAPLGTVWPVERAPSLSVADRLWHRQRIGTSVLVVHDVATRDGIESELGVDPLRYSEAEAGAVIAAYGNRVPAPQIGQLSGTDATLAGVLAATRRAPLDLLHINAHAIASPLVPSRSLLLLASGPESMASLAGLSLAGTVVVLSACRSATGEDRGGEGVAGLLWGPVAAGASTVVASLWVVNQQTTADLMGHFHRYRAQGAGEAAALMAARAELAHLHPYYWAGFVAFGSRRGDVPVAPSSSKWLWWLAAVGVLGLVSSRAASRRRRRLSAAPH